jgi:hypothetical protein
MAGVMMPSPNSRIACEPSEKAPEISACDECRRLRGKSE